MANYKYFKEEELACSHCGRVNMNELFMEAIEDLRERMGFPFVISSAYRCKDHPVEASKETPGAHNRGVAIDILVSGERAYRLLSEALEMGFVGIGVNQRGDHSQRFIHLDYDEEGYRPTIWSY